MTKEEFFKNRPFFEVLEKEKDLIGVEIGVESGLNAKNILDYLNISKLYLVDPYIQYNGFKDSGVLESSEIAESCAKYAINLLDEYEDKISWFMIYSNKAYTSIPDNLDFVYIDGNHRYEFVKEDIKLYYPKIKSKGFIAGHDFKLSEMGVVKAVNDFCRQNNLKFGQDNWDWWIRKE